MGAEFQVEGFHPEGQDHYFDLKLREGGATGVCAAAGAMRIRLVPDDPRLGDLRVVTTYEYDRFFDEVIVAPPAPRARSVMDDDPDWALEMPGEPSSPGLFDDDPPLDSASSAAQAAVASAGVGDGSVSLGALAYADLEPTTLSRRPTARLPAVDLTSDLVEVDEFGLLAFEAIEHLSEAVTD